MIRVGTSGRYRGDYPDELLRKRARWILDSGVKNGYAFFNNDIGGHAVKNARTLRRFLETLGKGKRRKK